MKRSVILICFLILHASSIFAQINNVSLRLQSPDGKTVKLIWMAKHWQPSYTGFDIKRLNGAGTWMTLNKKPICPELTAKKDFSLVESDKLEASRIRAKMLKWMMSGKKTEISRQDFQSILLNTDTITSQKGNVTDQFTTDYDMALINGFAYTDHSANIKVSYTYGLFISGTDSLLAKASWNYGEYPDLNVITGITTYIHPKLKGIELIWDADTNKIDDGSVTGFYVYRNGIRLNQNPLMTPTNKDSCEFVWVDSFADNENTYQFSISPVSLFGIEGSIKSYTYKSADHPKNYQVASAPVLSPQSYNVKDGILLNWTFPKIEEKYISGFYVEKNILPGGYQRISAIINSADRQYIDKSASPMSGYISYRIITAYNDKTISKSQERLFSYFPILEPPQPQGLKAVIQQKENKKQVINLSWNPPMLGDTVTYYYTVYVWDSLARKYEKLYTPKIQTNKYDYEVKTQVATTYQFAISAVAGNESESIFSNPAVIKTLSTSLPMVFFSRIFADGKNTLMEWNDYPEIADLKGFRIYQNNILVADEFKLTARTHHFTVITPGEGNFSYTIKAVSITGVESTSPEPSVVTFPVSEEKKKGK